MAKLESNLHAIAEQFVAAVLETIRKMPLQGLQPEGGRIGRGRAARGGAAPARAATRVSGRLPRRSADEIAKVLAQVVGLVKKHSDGLRAEQLRQELGLEAKEMPRVLKEGLARKVLKSKGRKRATTYFVVRPGKS